MTTSTLTPETATKLLLTRPWHRVTYAYARELRGSSPPYRVRCSCGWDAGWLRCTLPVALSLARSHVEPFTPPIALPLRSRSDDATNATTRPANPASALCSHSAPTRPASSLSAASPATLPPCALDASSASALALDWLARGD